MDAQELQDPEKESTVWVKHLYETGNKMNNTISLQILSGVKLLIG